MPDDYRKPKALFYWRNGGRINEGSFPKYFALYIGNLGVHGLEVPLQSPMIGIDEDGLRILKTELSKRGTDLIDAGSITVPINPRAINEAISGYVSRKASGEYLPDIQIDVDELAYSLMSEEQKLEYLSSLTGRMKDVMESPQLREPIRDEMERLGRHLKRYEVGEYIQAAALPTEQGHVLAGLYLQKFFAVCNERYEDAQKLQDRINKAKGSL